MILVFYLLLSFSLSPLGGGGHENKSFFASSQQEMSHIKFSPNELNIIWGDIRTVTTGNAHLFVITFILTLTFLNDLEPYTQVTCELQDHQRSILFFTWFKSLTQMTKNRVKNTITQIPIKINHHQKMNYKWLCKSRKVYSW